MMKPKIIINILLFCLGISTVNAQIFNESFKTTATEKNIADHTYNNPTSTFAGTAKIRSSQPSVGYLRASGGAGVYVQSATGTYLQINNINTMATYSPILSFGIYKGTTGNNGADLSIQYSTNNGANWTALPAMAALPTKVGWYYRTISGLPKSSNLSLKFIKTGNTNDYYIDDIAVDDDIPASDVQLETYTYKDNLQLDIFMPPWHTKTSTKVPVIVFVHGGSWVKGDKAMLYNQCRYFAKQGIVTATVNYRFMDKNATGYAATREICIRDAKSAIRWIKKKANDFGIDSSRVILGGGSAGGHIASMAALNANDNNDPSDDLSISTKAKALLLFNPAYKPEDSPSLMPYNYTLKNVPPSIIFFGSNDADWKPAGDLFYKFLGARGAESKMWVAEGKGHGFFNAADWALSCNVLAHKMLISLGLLDDKGVALNMVPAAPLVLQDNYTSQAAPFRETFVEATGNILLCQSENKFVYNKPVYSGSGVDMRSAQPSSGYANASGQAAVYFPKTESYFQIEGINTTTVSSPCLSFGLRAENNNGSEFIVEYSTDKNTWNKLSFNLLPGSTGWYYRTIEGLPQANNLSIRFSKAQTNNFFYLDDISVDSKSPAKLGPLRGVKWKQYSDDNFIEETVDWWLAVPDGKTKLQVLQTIATKANAVVIRVDDQSRFREPQQSQNFNKAMDDIVDAIKLIKDNNIPLDVYLWARIWFEDGKGKPRWFTEDYTATAVKERFDEVLNKAKTVGVLGYIKGINLVENNSDKIQDVKKYAKLVADKFNAETKWNDGNGTPFLMTRAFFVAGAGFGMDFRGVDDDNGTFLRDISGKCAHFAFTYKYMKATHETVTQDDYFNVPINGVTRAWDKDMEKDAASFSIEDRKAFLNQFGLSALTNYLETYKSQYPTAANIVFWGDKWDGISQIPLLSRVALQSLLLKNGGTALIESNQNYFFNLAASITTNEAANKFYLFDGNLAFNSMVGKSGKTIGEEWEAWPLGPTSEQVNTGAFQETFGTGGGNVTDLVSYTGYATKTPTDLGFTYSASSGVQIRSSQKTANDRHLFYPKAGGDHFQIAGINTLAIESPALAFEIKRGTVGGSGSDMAVKYSLNGGTTWTSLDMAAKVSSFPNTWIQVAFTGLPQTASLAIRFEKVAGDDNFFIDNIALGEETDFSVLPVGLIAFSATKAGSTAILQWATQSESNNSHFDIERSSEHSLDGNIFTVIGTKQGAGNSTVAQSYRFTDYNPASGTNYYRLVQYDNDGRSTACGVKAVSFDVGGTGMQILAGGNPQQISFSLQTAKGGNAQFALHSVDGKKISAQNIDIKEGNNIYTTNVPHLTTGVYVAVLQLSGNTYKAKLTK